MALTSGQVVDRRGPPWPGEFGYYVSPGEQIWRGGLVGVTAGLTLQRLQTAGTVSFVGLAMESYSNVGSAAPSQDFVRAARGIWALPVPDATGYSVGANVYATDDNTLMFAASGAVADGANTGNGTVTDVYATAAATTGAYTVQMTSPTAFSVTNPAAVALAAGVVGTLYTASGLTFLVNAGSVPFVAGDKFTITVADAPAGAFLVGTLSGVGENGRTYVRLIGS